LLFGLLITLTRYLVILVFGIGLLLNSIDVTLKRHQDDLIVESRRLAQDIQTHKQQVKQKNSTAQPAPANDQAVPLVVDFPTGMPTTKQYAALQSCFWRVWHGIVLLTCVRACVPRFLLECAWSRNARERSSCYEFCTRRASTAGCSTKAIRTGA
jgi:hypothetical protein